MDCLNKLNKLDGLVTIDHGRCREHFVTVNAATGESDSDFFGRAAAVIHRVGGSVESIEVFGVDGRAPAPLLKAFGESACPVTWVSEGWDQAQPLRGIQASVLTGTDVHPLRVGDRVVGVVFEIDGVRYCRLGGLIPPDLSRDFAQQADAIFELMQDTLALAEMDFNRVVRTWFYNYKMLDWYGAFNASRTGFFKKHGVFHGTVPASTGIGGANGAGAALTAGLIAVDGGNATALAVPSPLQCPAVNYGSSFSRAVELHVPGARRLFISGTASIDAGGESVHIGDIDGQVARTMEVVSAILESRRMGWNDATRAIAYFKYRKDVPAFADYCEKHGISLPALFVNNDICRHDLLFEIEVDAAVQPAA